MHVLLLTGRPGIGKTTVIRKVVDELEGKRVDGFFTEEIRRGGRRKGFRLKTLDGAEEIMAHVDIGGGPTVSRYRVDVEAVDRIVEETLTGEDVDLWVVDEIGRMECHSDRFVEAVERILDGDIPLLATVARKGGGLIAEARQHPDAEVVEVTRENRDELHRRIVQELLERI